MISDNIIKPTTNTNMHWYAIYVYVKCEKMAHDLLVHKGIETYLPLKTVVRQWGKQRRKKKLPLIPSYLFVRINPKDYVQVLETEKVLSFVKFSGKMVPIRDEEILVLQQLVGDAKLEVSLVHKSFKKGDNVEVIAGSLSGLKGVLKEIRGDKEVLIDLADMACSFSISVKKEMINLTK